MATFPLADTSLSAEKTLNRPNLLRSICRACPFLASDRILSCALMTNLHNPSFIFYRTNSLLDLSFREQTLPTASLILTLVSI